MTVKKLDQTLNVGICIIVCIIAIGCFFFSRTFKAPEFEPVESSVKIPYVYSSEDGERYDSFYVLAWMHKNFKSPQVVAYDPSNDNFSTFKPEYQEKYKEMMPESQYPFYTRWTLAIFILLALVIGAVIALAGMYIRDAILCNKIEKNKDFKDCSYFLFHDRIGFEKKVQSFIGDGIEAYIEEKSPELYKKYHKNFADLVVNILKDIRKRNTTTVPYNLIFIDNTIDQKAYLSDLKDYWTARIETDKDAESFIKFLNNQLEKKYIDICLDVKTSDIGTTVDTQMNKIFTEFLGEEIFKFKYRDRRDSAISSGVLYVDVRATNHSNAFTWSGKDIPSDTYIPGVSVNFKLYHYIDHKEHLLRSRHLGPVCNYECVEGAFDKSSLFSSMVFGALKQAYDKMTTE